MPRQQRHPTTDQASDDRVSTESRKSATPGRTGWYESIRIPRWVIYVQAGLLGLVATTFFVFGMMVGSLTSPAGTGASLDFDCRVVGNVAFRKDGGLRADDGAVVLLLPMEQKPDQRSPGELVNPDSFQALDNIAIDRIHELGGAVVRADENGQFDVVVDANSFDLREYYLIVVSKNAQKNKDKPMTKEQTAMLGSFFIPVEDVVDDQAVYSIKFVADGQRVYLPAVEF